jgi:broad specificity phosphatase PhoE
MPATIHCIRHAQGFHNLGFEYHTLQDPSLTPLGEQQCAALQQTSFPASTQRQISLITASPLTRTLHTAYLTFRPLLDATDANHVTSTNTPTPTTTPKILAIPDAQETSDFPCDTGSAPTILAKHTTAQNWPVDLSLLTENWTSKHLHTRYSPHSDAIKSRARATRQLLRAKARELTAQGVADPQIVLVTHGGFLHYFTGDWEDAAEGLGTGWKNCETRAYFFEDDQNLAGAGAHGEGLAEEEEEGVDEARLLETTESRARRGKIGERPSWDRQEELFEEAMAGWEAGGLQRPDRIGEAGWKSGLVEGQVEAAGPGAREAESRAEMENDGLSMGVAEGLERGQGVRVQA